MSSSGGSFGKESAFSAGDLGSVPRLGRSPGVAHGNALQHSCLENPHGQRSLAGCSLWTHEMLFFLERMTDKLWLFRLGDLPAFSQKWKAVSLTHRERTDRFYCQYVLQKKKKEKNRTLENWYLAEMTGCFWYCMMKCVSIWKICKLGEPIFSKWPVHSVTKPGVWVNRFIQIVSETKVFF